MPNIASFHPQIVHFIVVLGFIGVGLRLLSLVIKVEWIRPAATLALLAAAVSGVLAARSGDQAHGPAERVPGARPAVEEHEELGERARNLFLLVAGFEILALAMRNKEKVRRLALIGSAATGVVAAFFLFEAAEHGGELVYSYAGGVGTRSGNPEDVTRLLVAGLYHAARTARDSGDTASAARLTEELARQMPGDLNVAFLSARSLLIDRHDPAAAMALLNGLAIPGDNPRLVLQVGVLRSDAYLAMGHPDSAQAVLQGIAQAFPDNPQVQRVTAEAIGKIP
ncbi:MAG TPA: tetratricopeptide repeat protein [Gemmatimonadales bacterium]|nr:tetratricopeptide repeat protein [Gemmatimonadales bacterium]